jgi:signal transduction histidine kinase
VQAGTNLWDLTAGGREMQQFLFGFVVALLVFVPLVLVFLCKKGGTGGGGPENSALQMEEQKGEKARDKETEQLGRLIGVLAHEIKNPLSTIKINLKLAAEELQYLDTDTPKSTEQQRVSRVLRKIGVIRKEADRLEQILDGFLRYVDRSEPQLASNDINELIGDMVDFYSPQAYSHSITIRHRLYDKPLVCRIDADMLKQAILNLFINAQQAMSSGGELIITTSQENQDAVIQISDTGCGIAPEKLVRIFDGYYSSRPQGTGLGLPTVKRIVEVHNGTIAVDSQLGKGTLFIVKLPLSASNEQVQT